MKTYLHIALLLIFAMFLFDCSNKGTEPGDEKVWEDKLEFGSFKKVDTNYVFYPLDTFRFFNGAVSPRITFKEIPEEGTLVNLYIVHDEDTIYKFSWSPLPNNAKHTLDCSSLRLGVNLGRLDGYAHYIFDGVRTDIPTASCYVVRD